MFMLESVIRLMLMNLWPHAHVSEVPVLSGPHVHHLASELGLLVHQPVTVHHVAGLALVHAVTVHDVVTVLHHLVTLTTKFSFS
ncbi:hypothetical protein F7725_002414 [Dissostichus mawsoni]|uniref:Secreted protein n=1 Tax=Dissostichus mawsoni TaxID=36200 RepID=A0A7J5Y2B4_DISMA|nr:hypothetical protein F7725_002414 [Dissostichus mawsoni]